MWQQMIGWSLTWHSIIEDDSVDDVTHMSCWTDVASDVAWWHGRLTAYGVLVHMADFDLLARLWSARLSVRPELSPIGSCLGPLNPWFAGLPMRPGQGLTLALFDRPVRGMLQNCADLIETELAQPWWCHVSSHGVSIGLARRFDLTQTSPSGHALSHHERQAAHACRLNCHEPAFTGLSRPKKFPKASAGTWSPVWVIFAP